MCGGRSWTDLIPKCYQVPKLERKVFLSPSHFTGASKYFVLSLSLSIFVRIQLLTLQISTVRFEKSDSDPIKRKREMLVLFYQQSTVPTLYACTVRDYPNDTLF